MPLRSAVCPVYVGRSTELSAVTQGLERVRDQGAGRLLLISGPAGMGKSRLVAEIVRLSTGAGFVRLEGQCSADAAIPYAPFVTAIRRRTRVLSDDAVVELFAGPATLASALLPEVADIIGPTPARSSDDVHAAVWHVLQRLTRATGGLLVLEDLHWADPDSLRLLRYLALETDGLPLWIVGTYRSDEMHRRHPLNATLSDLNRARLFDEIALAPLTRAEVGDMLSAIFDGTEVSEEFAAAVHDRTEGNPFFIEELMKVMVERGDIFKAGSDWERRDLSEIEMPQSVRETLLARIHEMTDGSVEVLQLAALSGVDLDPKVLAQAADVGPDVVDDAIREGLAMQILAEKPGSAGSYVFRHALSREALADELVGPERRRAHGRLAAALEVVHADHLSAHAAELADHFAAAGDREAAINYGLIAARSAVSAMSTDEADVRYNHVLHLLDDDDPRRLDVALEAARTAEDVTTSNPKIKTAFAEEARRLARSRGDVASEVDAIVILSSLQWDAGDGGRGIELLRAAHELTRGQDDFREAWILGKLTRLLALASAIDPADPLIADGLRLAESSQNYRAISAIRGTQMILEPGLETIERHYAESIAAARHVGDLMREGNTHLNAGYIALWLGDFEMSRSALHRAVDIYERVAPSDHYGVAGEAWLASLAGDYELAAARARVVRHSGSAPVRIVGLTAMAEIALRQDDPDIASVLDEVVELALGTGEAQRSVPASSALARWELRTAGIDAAMPRFQQVLKDTRSKIGFASHWMFSPDLAIQLAQADRVRELDEWVGDIEDLTTIDPNEHNQAAFAFVRGLLQSARGDLTAASESLADAHNRYSHMPCPARQVEVLIAQAEVAAKQGSTDDVADTLASAEEIARRLGATALLATVEATRTKWLSRPVLATLMFTDMVGSTENAASLGDRAWRDHLERHHSVVRRALPRHGGREIDTAGDGFLVAFDSPAAAVRCAVEVQQALADIDIPIRVGIHTGECQEFGGKLTGLTVHIASRVSQQAKAGEVLVSSTVRELLVGAGLTFAEHGTYELKGIPGEWRIYAVAS